MLIKKGFARVSGFLQPAITNYTQLKGNIVSRDTMRIRHQSVSLSVMKNQTTLGHGPHGSRSNNANCAAQTANGLAISNNSQLSAR